MKKRMISMAMTAVMALTLVVVAAPAEVHASSSTADTTVSYTHQNATAGDDWVVQIPAGIVVTEADKTVDASVKILNKIDNEAYTGTKKVDITVNSANGYELQSSGTVKLAYELKYANVASGTNFSVGELSSTKTTISGTVKVTGSEIAKAVAGATYTDTLTYTITPQS